MIEIVESRGKMHNPETESGGVLLGTVTAVGERYQSPPARGDRIATLASLTLTPLRLDSVRSLDPGSPQIEVSGTAYVCDRAAWAPVPEDLPLARALEIYDVCAAASQTGLWHSVAARCACWAPACDGLALAAARDAGAGTWSPWTSTRMRSSASLARGLTVLE